MTLFGVFARSDFQLAPSSSVQSQQMTQRKQKCEARKGKKSRKDPLEFFWSGIRWRWSATAFYFLSSLIQMGYLNQMQKNYSVIRSAKQRGPEVKLSGFPGLTTKMMPPGSQEPRNFFKNCVHILYLQFQLHALHIRPFCLMLVGLYFHTWMWKQCCHSWLLTKF